MGFYSKLLPIGVAPGTYIKDLEGLKRHLENHPEILAFADATFLVAPDGYLFAIELEETYGKFYDDYIFAQILSRYLKSGSVTLRFVGENYAMWGYKVEPNKVTELTAVWVPVKSKILGIIIPSDDKK